MCIRDSLGIVGGHRGGDDDGIGAGDVRRGVPDVDGNAEACLLYTSPSPRDRTRYRMPSSA